MLELSDPLEFPLGLVAPDFRIEKPSDLIERRQVRSRSLDPRLIDGDRRHDLIASAAQGGRDMHRMKLEHNKNIVKLISELPEARPAGYVGKKIQGGFFPLALRIASITAVGERLTDERVRLVA